MLAQEAKKTPKGPILLVSPRGPNDSPGLDSQSCLLDLLVSSRFASRFVRQFCTAMAGNFKVLDLTDLLHLSCLCYKFNIPIEIPTNSPSLSCRSVWLAVQAALASR